MLRATRTVLLIALLGVASQAAAGGSSGPPQRTHVVRTGENLTRIAAATGVSVGDLVRLNHLRDQNRIVIGQRLVLPAPNPPPKPLPARLLRHPERLAFRPSFRHWARAYGTPPDLLQALAWVESGWQVHVVSRTGAVGIGQLQPATVAFVSQVLFHLRRPLDPHDPDANIRMSARFLRLLLDTHAGHADQAVAAYYQGSASISRIGLLTETRHYVATVLAYRPFFAG